MKVNLGCGKLHLDGFVNVDWVEPADVVCDVTKGLPFKDGEVERIQADNLFEHFNNDEFLTVMNECHRVLQDGGVLWFKVPDALNWMDGAFGDPTHKRFFVPRSFNYLDREHPTHINYGKEYGFKGWKRLSVVTDKKFFTAELQK